MIDREGGSYKKPGHRLGSAYEQELEKKLRSVAEFNFEINDLSEKLVDKYNDREKEFQQNYADMENKASQLIASSTEVRSKFISERRSRIELEAKIKSLKSNIKTLKREATLAQKASSADKVQILFLETKIRELEEIDSLRLELERAKEDLNSKEYTIECMEKGIESSNSIFRQEIDALYSARSKLREENMSFRDQLELKEKPRGASHNEVDPLPPPMNNSLQLGPKGILPTLDPTISVGGAEAVPLLATIPIIASSASLISPMVMYSILALLLIAQVEGAPLSKIQKMQIPHFPGKWWEIVENATLR
ncbi:unnamed protein product [Rhizophagus irregularis]|nr:unnamed protein product [Rhizophagus irregularis]